MKDRIWRRIETRIQAPAFSHVQAHLTPPLGGMFRVWQSVGRRLTPLVPVPLLERIRAWCDPAPVPRALTWAAAFCIAILGFHLTLPIFLAPPTLAESPVLLLPTRGQSTYLSNGLWEPIARETPLRKSAVLQTGADGSLTVVVRDDFLLRMAPGSTVAVHDLSDRPQPSAYEPTLTLHAGRIWVQGLVPSSVRPVSVQTPGGMVLVRDGSVSIETADRAAATVRVWNRHANVQNDGLAVPLIAGERVDLRDGRVTFLKSIVPSLYDESWVAENLRADAAHRIEIAQAQHERRAAAAGILPTSTLYPVKRFAEEVNVLLSLSSEARIQKRLQQAESRLNEAAALLQEGSDDARVALQEYRETIFWVANGSGGSALAQSLIQEQVNEAAADLGAALPTDPSSFYELKKTVLQTSASLPEGTVTADDVRGTIVLDTLAGFRQKIEERDADLSAVRQEFAAYDFDPSGLTDDARKEAEASYRLLAHTLGVQLPERGPEGATAGRNSTARLSPAETKALALDIRDDIYNNYDQLRGRHNELARRLQMLEGHPDRGSVLRYLAQELNHPDLERVVRIEMSKVKSELRYVSGSGKSL